MAARVAARRLWYGSARAAYRTLPREERRGGRLPVGALVSLSSVLAASACHSSSAAGPAVTQPKGGEALRPLDIQLYQYKICPFCNKLKAVMDYYSVPFGVTEVNPLTKKELAFSPDYKKVPVVRMRGETFADSPLIIEALLKELREAKAVPEAELAAFASPEALRWADWADKKLAVLLFPNITRNFSESYQAFGYVWDVPTFGVFDKAANQLLGATAMWAAQGKLKKKYDIQDERGALAAALAEWEAALAEQPEAPFAGGEKPHLGDVAVFGCLHALAGLDTFHEALSSPALNGWYQAMKSALKYDGKG